MNRLQHRVVVITGASSGIGRATALAFAREGAAVVLFARRQEALEGVAAACRGHGAEAHVVAGDVADAEAVDRLARTAAGRFGRIDVWVNNAAVQLYGPLEAAPVQTWHRVVETNLLGTYHGIRAALPWMREQGAGVIVNVASVLGRVPAPYQSAYVASKFGILGLTESVRQEVRDVDALHVCAVLPGAIDTPLFQQAANYMGRAAVPPPPVIDAHRVAEAIVGCVRRPRREVPVGWSTRQALAFRRLVPRLVERVAARQVEREHFSEQQVAATDGNLLRPAPGTGTISGGWPRRGGRHRGSEAGPSTRRHEHLPVRPGGGW